ncbi:hypothetical protein H5410_045347 [Solanum commersonii]|uniref:Uncharacterized protein n=1 Tax=Solanum commersonii TaxID=4109 RepID=A0A9J5X9A3_SOLCO|nr:hypothetical protein H5410_045347 [Solanum commersonii]
MGRIAIPMPKMFPMFNSFSMASLALPGHTHQSEKINLELPIDCYNFLLSDSILKMSETDPSQVSRRTKNEEMIKMVLHKIWVSLNKQYIGVLVSYIEEEQVLKNQRKGTLGETLVFNVKS